MSKYSGLPTKSAPKKYFPSRSKNYKPEILNARVKATAFIRVVLAGITFLVPAYTT